MMRRTLFLILTLMILSAQPTLAEPQQGKILVAVYASGNTLESQHGLITEDLKQMITGMNNTSPADLDLLVAYGGANKTGWRGMTLVNRTELTEDIADGYIGNSSRFIARDEEADMGTSDALLSFIRYIKEHYQYDRVFLILIGHGEAYTGMLFDENHQDDGLTISELGSALKEGGMNVELIGFDSCLMSTLELAATVQGYSRYMIASEESEPAEGWDYQRWFAYLSAHPDMQTPELGGELLSEYMKSHEPGKTLSLLDLRETGLVTDELEKFSQNLIPLLKENETYRSVQNCIARSQQFGLTETGRREEATLDLFDLATQVHESIPSLGDSASSLTDALDKMVILSRHDDLEKNAHGVAIISPLRINPEFYAFYQDEASVTPSWNLFMQEYLKGPPISS